MAHTFRVGCVGVGRMGANMVRRLADLRVAISGVTDADPRLAQSLAAELDCPLPETLRELAERSDVVLTVVSDDAAMREIFADRSNSLLAAAQGKMFVNCATVSPAVHRELAPIVRAAGGSYLEACMASSITQARDGSLYLICGGERAAFDRVLGLLQQLGSVRYVGDTGRAAEVKALVNMLMNINTAALAEALGLGDALGIDLDLLRDVFANTGARSRVLETDGGDMQTRDHDVYFSAAHAAKDSHIALSIAQDAGLDLPLARLTAHRYDELVEAGFGELDKSAIAELTFRGRGISQ